MTTRRSRKAKTILAAIEAAILKPHVSRPAEIEHLIDPSIEMATSAIPIDHHSQLANWMSVETSVEDDTPVTLTDEENEALASFIPEDELAEMVPCTFMGIEGWTQSDVLATPASISGLSEKEPAEASGALMASDAFVPETGVVADTTVSEKTAPEVTAETSGATEAELEAALAMLDAVDPTEPVAPPAPEVNTQKTWDDILTTLPQESVHETIFATAAAFDDRVEFERTKDPENANIQRTLKKARAVMTTRRAAQVMLATNVLPSVINRVFHDGSRYNVYAIGKLADLIFGLTKNPDNQQGMVTNAINLTCVRSLFRGQPPSGPSRIPHRALSLSFRRRDERVGRKQNGETNMKRARKSKPASIDALIDPAMEMATGAPRSSVRRRWRIRPIDIETGAGHFVCA
jgi:hypothetical protein